MAKKLPSRPKKADIELGDDVRVGLYKRISTDELNQPWSLGAQDSQLNAYVQSQPGWRVVGTYDDEISGAKGAEHRPGMAQLLADAKAGKFDVVLVQRVDRVARKIQVLSDIVSELTESGVALRSSSQPFDTSDASGLLILNLLGILAEFERDQLIDRITAGIGENARRGGWTGGAPPYGYELINKDLVPKADEAKVVRKMFELYTTDMLGFTAVRNWLNEHGYRNRSGKRWGSKQVGDIIGGWIYAGFVTHWDEVYPGKHTALVSRDTWDEAQNLTEQRTSRSLRQRADSPYLFSHLLRCSLCGASLSGTAANNGRGGRYRYYTCQTRSDQGKESCALPPLGADDVDQALINALTDAYADGELFREAARAALAAQSDRRPALETELSEAKRSLTETQEAIDTWYRAVETGSVSERLIGERLNELMARRVELNEAIADLDAQLDLTVADMPTADDIAALAQRVPAVLDGDATPLKKAFLSSLIDEVAVTEDRTLHPVIRIPSTPLTFVEGEDGAEIAAEGGASSDGRRRCRTADTGSGSDTPSGDDGNRTHDPLLAKQVL